MGRRRGSRQQRRRQTADRSRSRRTLWFGAAALVIIGGAAYLASAPLRTASAPAPAGAPDAVPVIVSMGGFEPNRLTAKAGGSLALRFVNYDNQFHTDGGGWHQFRIEAQDVDVRIAPLERRTFTLQNLAAGTYEFYCDVCCGGKENPAMRGVLEVSA